MGPRQRPVWGCARPGTHLDPRGEGSHHNRVTPPLQAPPPGDLEPTPRQSRQSSGLVHRQAALGAEKIKVQRSRFGTMVPTARFGCSPRTAPAPLPQRRVSGPLDQVSAEVPGGFPPGAEASVAGPLAPGGLIAGTLARRRRLTAPECEQGSPPSPWTWEGG